MHVHHHTLFSVKKKSQVSSSHKMRGRKEAREREKGGSEEGSKMKKDVGNE